jgi:hypothetical protein
MQHLKVNPKITLSHDDIMALLPADICRGCQIRIYCKEQWRTHPSFECNALVVLQKILVFSRATVTQGYCLEGYLANNIVRTPLFRL